MALIKYGGGVIQASGSIAGNTFARNRFGNYMRAKTKPINPRSTKQSEVRSVLSFLTAQWSQLLTAVQRESWNLYGKSVAMKNKLGETVFLTGFNHYIRSNAILKIRGESLVADGPTIFELPAADPTMYAVVQVHEQSSYLYFDDAQPWVGEEGGWCFILEGRPQNPQRNFFNGPFLGIKDVKGKIADPYTSPERFTNQHIVGEGQKIWHQFRIQRADGRITEPFYSNTIVVAGPIVP